MKKRDNGKYYAMKMISKASLIENDQVESTKLEKQILSAGDHPFLVRMSYVFQTEAKLYFVMHFIRGGELYQRLAT